MAEPEGAGRTSDIDDINNELSRLDGAADYLAGALDAMIRLTQARTLVVREQAEAGATISAVNLERLIAARGRALIVESVANGPFRGPMRSGVDAVLRSLDGEPIK